MSQDALGQLKHLKTARARWPFPDVEGLPTGFLSCAPIIILLNCAEHISGENSQNFVFSEPVT